MEKTLKSIHVPDYQEVLRKVSASQKRYRKGRFIETELCRLDSAYNIICSKLSFVDQLESVLSNLPQLHASLISEELESVRQALERVKRARRITRILWRRYRAKLLEMYRNNAGRDELRKTRKEGVARMLSAVKRCNKHLLLLRKVVIELSKVPDLDTLTPVVLLLGASQVGKSTLARRISTAKSEIGEYLFTTKDIVIGHMMVELMKVQVLDVPGLVHDFESITKIEKKALAAVKVADVVIYVFDVSKSPMIPIMPQLELFHNVMRLLKGKHVVMVANKIDYCDPCAAYLVRSLAARLSVPLFFVSALLGHNIESFVEHLCKTCMNIIKERIEDRTKSITQGTGQEHKERLSG